MNIQQCILYTVRQYVARLKDESIDLYMTFFMQVVEKNMNTGKRHKSYEKNRAKARIQSQSNKQQATYTQIRRAKMTQPMSFQWWWVQLNQIENIEDQ